VCQSFALVFAGTDGNCSSYKLTIIAFGAIVKFLGIKLFSQKIPPEEEFLIASNIKYSKQPSFVVTQVSVLLQLQVKRFTEMKAVLGLSEGSLAINI